MIAEKTGSNWKDYIVFAGQRVAEQTGSTAASAVYLHTDHLGSTRRCTNADGSSAGTCDYEPFGENQPGTSCSVPTRFRFAGMDFDADTALYHTWFREYDPNQGRWMAVDPLPGSEDDPQSRDRYAYVLNDPVNFLDPLGLDCAQWVLVYDASNEYSPWSWQGRFCGGTAARATSTNCDKTKAGCASGGGSAGSGNPQPPQPQPPQPQKPSLRPPTEQEYNDCIAKAEKSRDQKIQSARGKQAAGGLLTLVGAAEIYLVATGRLPDRKPDAASKMIFTLAGQGHLLLHGHGVGSLGVNLGVFGPAAAGLFVFGSGSIDVAAAWDEYNRDVINCASAVRK